MALDPAGRPVSPRKVLCSLGVGAHRQFLDLSRPSFEDYAERHGYELVTVRRALTAERPISWSKVLLIQDLLADYDFVLWVDADATFVDTSADVADVAKADRFLWMVEHAYRGGRQPCAAVMAVHRGEESTFFLESVWGRGDLVDHPWWEQAAMLSLMGYDVTERDRARFLGPTRWTDRIGFLSTRWNSMPSDPHADPYIVHLAGMSNAERMPLLRRYAQEFRRRSSMRRSSHNEHNEQNEQKASRRGEREEREEKVSVVLPLPPSRFERAAASLVALTGSGLIDGDEVILVDADSGLGGLTGPAEGIKVLPVPRGFGSSDSWQVGCENAGNDIVVLLGDLVRPRPGWLDRIVSELTDGGAAAVAACWVPQSHPSRHDASVPPGQGGARQLGAPQMAPGDPEPGEAAAVQGTLGEARVLQGRRGHECLDPTTGPAVGLRRVDALRALTGGPWSGPDMAALCMALASDRRKVTCNPSALVDYPLAEEGWTRSLDVPASVPLPVVWYRWTYRGSAPQLPCREELPFLLNACGLRAAGVVVGERRGQFAAHLLVHWEGEKLTSIWWADSDHGAARAGHGEGLTRHRDPQEELWFAEARARLAVFGARSEIRRSTPVEAARALAPASIDFVYLDADRDGVLGAPSLEAWLERIRPGGILAGSGALDQDLPGEDPSTKPGVKQGVKPRTPSTIREILASKGIEAHETTDGGTSSAWFAELPGSSRSHDGGEPIQGAAPIHCAAPSEEASGSAARITRRPRVRLREEYLHLHGMKDFLLAHAGVAASDVLGQILNVSEEGPAESWDVISVTVSTLREREAALLGQLADQEREIQELRSGYEREIQELRSGYERTVEEHAQAIAALHASTSWRLTAPLRWVKVNVFVPRRRS